MNNTPETIYLIPGEYGEGRVWSEDPEPSYADDPADAVEYVRADKTAPARRIVIRYKESVTGRPYIAAEFFSYDRWWSTDLKQIGISGWSKGWPGTAA